MIKIPLYIRKQAVLSGCAYIGHFLVGYCGVWPSNVIVMLQDPDRTPLPEVVSEYEASLIAALTYVGLVGTYVGGYLSNVKGRVPCLQLGAMLGIIAYLLKIFAVHIAMIYVGRVIIGLSTGILMVINVVYVAEISSTNIRGILLVGICMSNTLGALFGYIVGGFGTYAVTTWVGLALSLCAGAGTFIMSESPYFYVLTSEGDKVSDTLMNLGREADINKIMSTKLDEPASLLEGWREIFTIKSNRKAMYITVTLMVMQQLSGSMVVIMFATSIFDLINSSLESHISTIIIGATQFLSSSITPLFIERSGRRMLMLITSFACSLSLTMLGLFFYLDHINHSSVESIQWLPLVSLMSYVMFYNFGFAIIPGMFNGEMFDTKVRSSGGVLSVSISWVLGFIVSLTYTNMVDNLGSYTTFWFYAAMCAFTFFFTAVFVPETRGKSLEEVKQMLSK